MSYSLFSVLACALLKRSEELINNSQGPSIVITETEFSVQATKDLPRKERPKENDSSFQDIFTALTATLQMANPQAANTLGVVQNSGKNFENTVRETSRRSGQDKKDLDRIDQNNSIFHL